MVTKANARMKTCMEAMEKVIEENCKAVESWLNSIEGMIQRLAAAWEKKSPTTNVHTTDTSGGNEGTTTHDENRWRNLEMQIFDGEDPMGWLTKNQKIFSVARRKGRGQDEGCNGHNG